MRNKRIIYIILMLLTCFIYMDRVSATTDKVCKYSKSGKYDVYLYQTSDGNHYAYKMSSDGNNHEIYNASLKSDIGDFSECPKYMQVYNSDTKFGFTDDKHWNKLDYNNIDYNDDKSYTSWQCSYGNVVVKQNKKGLISYTIDGKDVTNNYLQFYDYSFDSGTCPGYFASNAYKYDDSKLVFYKDKSVIENMGNDPTNGYTVAVDMSSGEISENGDVNKSCSKDGTNCKYASNLNNNSNVMIFENVGYCSKLDLAKDYSEPDAFECGRDNGSKVDLRFINSSYMILTYNSSTGLPVYVYLPTSSDTDDAIKSRISEYKSGKVKIAYVAEFFDQYTYDEVSALQSFSECNKKSSDGEIKKYCRIQSELDWFNFTDGINANEYDTEPVFWKKYGLSLSSLDESKADHPDGVTDDTHYENSDANAVYLCTYNSGNMVMRVKTGTAYTKVSIFFPNNTTSASAFYKYKIGEGTDSAISWIGDENHYSSVESGNSGIFESDLSNKVCPKQVNFDSSGRSTTICYQESDCEGVGGYEGKNPVWSLGTEDDISNETEFSDCSELISDDLRTLLNKYFLAFRIIVPLLVLGLGSIDFAKAVFGSKEEDMKKSQTSFVKRLIVAVAIFFIPTFVNLLLDVANTVWGWNAGTCNIENIDE